MIINFCDECAVVIGKEEKVYCENCGSVRAQPIEGNFTEEEAKRLLEASGMANG